MGKQNAVIKLSQRRAREALEESEDIPHYKRTGGIRPLNGLCCVQCSDKAFDKLEVPKTGACHHPVYQDNVMLCVRCSLTCQDETLCRSCGKSIQGLLNSDRDERRRAEKERRDAAKRPLKRPGS